MYEEYRPVATCFEQVNLLNLLNLTSPVCPLVDRHQSNGALTRGRPGVALAMHRPCDQARR